MRFCRWIGRGLRRLWAVGTRVDLTDSATKTLLRLLAVNFVVLTLCCCAWFFGILGLAAYTVILFFVLRKRFGQIQRDYRTLLAAHPERWRRAIWICASRRTWGSLTR